MQGCTSKRLVKGIQSYAACVLASTVPFHYCTADVPAGCGLSHAENDGRHWCDVVLRSSMTA